MPIIYYPERYALSISKDLIYVVGRTDEVNFLFKEIVYFDIFEFIRTRSVHGCLFIVESKAFTDYRRNFILTAILECLDFNKANYEVVLYPYLSRHFSETYKSNNIKEVFHMPLWLCSYNQSKYADQKK